MTFLEQQNRRVAGDTVSEAESILASGKNVLVLGGGDTGSDCIGTSHRQGAKHVYNFELLGKPASADDPDEGKEWRTIVCESRPGRRSYCPIDTTGGIRPVRRLSSASCDGHWGYDDEGIWVEDGCRAEFMVAVVEAEEPDVQLGKEQDRVGGRGNSPDQSRLRRPDPQGASGRGKRRTVTERL